MKVNKKMIENFLVSIVIPNFNNEEYLVQCLESCMNQTYKNIEIIVVDDCSSDNSIGIVKEYQKRDKRIRLIQNETNLKVSTTRHIGIQHANAEWITTLDSDDFYISQEKIEKEIELLKMNNFQKNTIAFSGIVQVKEYGLKIKSVMQNKNTKEGDIFECLVVRSCAIPRDFIFSKELYYEVGGYDSHIPIYEDWDLKLRLSKKAQYYYTGIEGIGYRLHGKGLSSAKKAEHIKWLNYVFNKNTKEVENKEDLKKLFTKNINPSLTKKVVSKLKKIVK